MADRTVTYTFRGDFTSLAAGLTAAGRATADLGGELTALDKNGAKMRAGLTTIGQAAGKMGLAAGLGLAAAAKAAIDWESAWAGVAKTVNGSAAEMADLEGQLREMARTMPATHEEIAAVAEAAGQLGVSVGDIADFTKVMIELGASTNLSADEASTAIAQFMNVMGTAGGAVDNLGATLVDLGNKGASTESQILDLAQRLSGAGALVGASEQDVLGLASAMANLGIQAELGGGAIQRVFVNLNTAVADGGDQLQGFADVAGMSADKFAQKWTDSPIKAFDAFLQGLNGIQASGGNVTEVFYNLGIKGTQNLQVMLRLAGAGDMLTDSLQTSNSAWKSNTALTAEYGRRMETTAAQVQVAWNNIKDAAIEVGAATLPAIGKAAKGVGAMARAFGDLPGPIKSATAGLLGLTSILGGGLWFTSKVINGVTEMKTALSNLGIEAGTTRQRLATLGTAGAAAALGVGTLVDTLSQWDSWNRSRAAADATTQSYQDLADALSYSNVGKYANDLHINLGRLTEDLINNGEHGEYASRVINDLADASHGWGALLQAEAGHIIPFYTDSASKAADANKDLTAILENSQGVLGQGADAATEAASATDSFGNATQSATTAAEAEADAIAAATKAMRDHADAALAAFDAETAWRQALKDARAQADKSSAGIKGNTDEVLANRNALSGLAAQWNNQSNAVKNNVQRYRDARASFIQIAEAMGVTSDKARTLANSWLQVPKKVLTKVDADTGKANQKITQARNKFDELDGTHVEPKIDANNKPAKGKVDQTNAFLRMLDGKTATPTVDANTFGAMSKLHAVKSELAGIVSKTITVTVNTVRHGLAGMAFASGGYTGPGGVQEPAGIVHKGEVVIPQRYVKRDWSMLRARYGDLPGFASGGYVSDYARAGAGGTPDFGLVGPVNAATAALLNLADASKKELEARKKLLDKEFEAAKQRLDNLKQERASLVQSVKDVIAGGDLFTVTQPSTLSMSSGEWNQDYYDLLQQHNAALAEQGGVTSNVGAMLSEGRERLALIRQLKRMGIKGQALAVLATQPIEVLRELASNKSEAHQFAQQFSQLQNVAQAAGAFTGNAVYGQQLKAAQDTNRAIRELDKRTNHELREIRKAIERQRHEAKKNSDDNAKQTAAGVNHGVAKAARRHVG